MSINATKKLEALNQKISSLQQAQEKAQNELASEFLNIIKHTEAFSVDFPTFVGGALEVISKIQSGKAEGKEWQKAGLKFIKSKAKSHKEKQLKKPVTAPQSDAAQATAPQADTGPTPPASDAGTAPSA